jgi:transcriptional regulator with XRE-family HTH domain
LGEVQKRLGARIKQIRDERQMTQEKVAEQAKRSYKYIGEVERGVANPSVKVLENLAAALGVQVADFFAPSPASTYPSHEPEMTMVRELADSLEEMAARLRRSTRTRTTRVRSKKR